MLLKRLVIALVLTAACAAPARACLANYNQGLGFWDKPPTDLRPGEVVLEVEFGGEAEQVVRGNAEGDNVFPSPQYGGDVFTNPDEFPFATSCGAATAYRVKRVLHGEFDGDMVLVGPFVILHDETWNPFRKRILVGTLDRPIKAALVSVRNWREHVFLGAPMEPRLVREWTPSTVDRILSLPERLVFGGARLIGFGLSHLIGVTAEGAAGLWFGLAVIAAFALSIALLIWRARRKQTAAVRTLGKSADTS